MAYIFGNAFVLQKDLKRNTLRKNEAKSNTKSSLQLHFSLKKISKIPKEAFLLCCGASIITTTGSSLEEKTMMMKKMKMTS